MDLLIIALATAGAVWYLCRKFARAAKPEDSTIGCSGCGGCSAANRKTHKN